MTPGPLSNGWTVRVNAPILFVADSLLLGLGVLLGRHFGDVLRKDPPVSGCPPAQNSQRLASADLPFDSPPTTSLIKPYKGICSQTDSAPESAARQDHCIPLQNSDFTIKKNLFKEQKIGVGISAPELYEVEYFRRINVEN